MEKMPKILVVDDEYHNLFLMHGFLVPLGYEVSISSDGEEAIEFARKGAFDVILLDINMPEMDGFEVLARLRSGEETKFVPVVMVTGQGEVEHRVRALELGADDFLTKPVDWMELKARVRSLVKVKAYHDHMMNHQRKLEEEVNRRTLELRRATEKLHEAHNKLKEASLDTIYRLSRAAEFRDEDTGGHIKRMSEYAAAVGRKMGLNEKTVEGILYAAPMHDVGKIGIPDRILLKPGKLDAEEWEIMKQHTLMGARILEGASGGFISLAAVIALTHHEKWNGKGYPRGLSGTQIPLVGRVVAIADVFDAMTSKRPYKEPFPVEKAFRIIEESRGSHFDPAVVDAFTAIKDEILEIKGSSDGYDNNSPLFPKY
ncbi:HD domain-containing phosphohydrolase [Desulforhabdus amnigena]|jgi:putative two-component system response regulator|uniref:Two-component system response regulator n=1 Tax=Desulforhabdus amnigena TaxID=40218 RepID=A0A9W6CVW0_9BACT|nr:HD domain-containing phosphohydrolase [Desulforhabdus amnigena]NLJ27943.1 response regulator [Deltaproteobacteria bacterium]GLI33509.1 two-component system response regulator [Desulforhabdus amnigena]